ncbi:MAG: cobalamin-dependent protein [Deltaproteobacteria bacterium]|nr:MAG: cobalamin-dependent protein [Deltaproteobacteria bacterium]
MAENQTTDLILQLKRGIINYDETAVKAAAHKLVSSRIDAKKAILEGLVAGMKSVGELYDRKEIFLPEILISTEIFYTGLNILKGGKKEEGLLPEKIGEIVIGTVEGDIHDLGKNIVKIMLETSGFVVHDLGANVPAEKFVDELKKSGVQIVALSTMMTTTLMEMDKIVDLVHSQKLNARIIIGGAAVTPEIANRFEADGFAPNAFGAVKLAKRLITGNQE